MMAEGIIQKAGGGVGSDEVTAGKAQVLAGYTAVTKDSNDEPAAGAMANQGAKTAALNCGGSYGIPAGYHNGSGKVTANSLASQTGGATAEDRYVLNGKTYWKDGVKRTGGMTVASVASFSVAAYSTSQVLATWKNPSRGPYSGVIICAKTGGYPANINNGRVYTGVGSNSAVNGTSSQVIGGLTAGVTYYFRVWVYCTCSAGDLYSGYLQATCKVTAHGRQVFTSSGTFTVPAGVRSINIHCTGGGSSGSPGSNYWDDTVDSGGGGAGGFTSYKNGISVSPGQQIVCNVGNGGNYVSNNASKDFYGHNAGGTSSASLNGSTLVSAGGASYYYASSTGGTDDGGKGGSNGGNGSRVGKGTGTKPSDNGGSNGTPGQGTSTREFGTGTLYSGGGGGGSCTYKSRADKAQAGSGGSGGGGNGGFVGFSDDITIPAQNGSAGTGGGGGGAGIVAYSRGYNYSNSANGTNGGSGNVIITW